MAKKRIRHPKSILHQKDGTCYLCMRLDRIYKIYPYIEEHHAIPGHPGRRLSEENGLKVYLCVDHHRIGPKAVHNNHENMRVIQKDAQIAYERTHSHDEWMELFGRNYL